jgi:hypothetical protein
VGLGQPVLHRGWKEVDAVAVYRKETSHGHHPRNEWMDFTRSGDVSPTGC